MVDINIKAILYCTCMLMIYPTIVACNHASEESNAGENENKQQIDLSQDKEKKNNDVKTTKQHATKSVDVNDKNNAVQQDSNKDKFLISDAFSVVSSKNDVVKVLYSRITENNQYECRLDIQHNGRVKIDRDIAPIRIHLMVSPNHSFEDALWGRTIELHQDELIYRGDYAVSVVLHRKYGMESIAEEFFDEVQQIQSMWLVVDTPSRGQIVVFLYSFS